MSGTGPWTCPACNVAVSSPFCPNCGERPLDPRELTLRGVFHQAIQAFTNLDARLIRSVRSLVTRPGTLTLAYLRGPRKPYIGPFALFLLTNVLFVAMESLTGSNIFSTPLDKHLHNQPWSPFAEQLVSDHVRAAHTTLEAYAPVFDEAVANNAKSLIVLMVLPFALLPPLIFYRGRFPVVTHVAFSLHFHAFMLLLISVSLLVPAIDLLLGGAGMASQVLDNAIAIMLLVVCGLYLYAAAAAVYEARGVRLMLKSVLLVVAAAGIFLGYRFLLLLITLSTT